MIPVLVTDWGKRTVECFLQATWAELVTVAVARPYRRSQFQRSKPRMGRCQ